MTLLLRKQRAQERIEGRQSIIDWKDDDYAVADGETRIGRIYKERLPGGEKWRWFIQVMGAPLRPSRSMPPVLRPVALLVGSPT